MTLPVHWLPALTTDGWLLFATYSVRLVAYGFVSVVLGLYLAAIGFGAASIGLVFTAAIGGGGVMTALLSWAADRWGRRRVLVLGALLMAGAGVVLATSSNLVLLIVAVALGMVSRLAARSARSCRSSRRCCRRPRPTTTGRRRSRPTTWSARQWGPRLGCGGAARCPGSRAPGGLSRTDVGVRRCRPPAGSALWAAL